MMLFLFAVLLRILLFGVDLFAQMLINLTLIFMTDHYSLTWHLSALLQVVKRVYSALGDKLHQTCVPCEPPNHQKQTPPRLVTLAV